VTTTVRHAEAALSLRRLAIAILTGGAAPEQIASAGSAEAWGLFLKVERCAAALREALTLTKTRSSGDAILDEGVRDDAQRSLSTRGQLATIAAIARERSWPVVVLKGAAAAATGNPVHMVDVDVLVKEEYAVELARELSTRLGVTMEGRPSPRHLAPIGTPHALPVEIHTSIDNRWTALTERAWQNIVPLDNLSGLSRLSPRDHTLHMLTHVVIDHPDRRGRLRDSLLIGSALAECDADAKREIARVIGSIPYAKYLGQQLDFAQALAEYRAEADPFEMAAFSRFWMVDRERTRRPPGTALWGELYPTMWHWVIGQAAGWSNRQRMLDGLHELSAAPSALPLTAWLERHASPVGRTLRLAIRAAQYILTYILAWPLARAIRRDARRAGVKR